MSQHSPVWRRIARGFGANMYGQVVVAIVQLAGVPILLHFWGVQLYGEWLILFAIPSYLSITDLGFSHSAGNDMTQWVARGDRTKALVVFQSLIALVTISAIIGLLVATAVVLLLPLHSWLHLQSMTPLDARLVLALLAAEVLVALISNVNRAGFVANSDYAMYALLYSSTLLTQFVALWVIVAMGYGPVMGASAFLLVRIAAMLLSSGLLLRRHRWLAYGFKNARVSELRRLVRPSAANLAMPLAQALSIQGMLLVVGAILGPLAVVVFSTLRTLTRVVFGLVSGVSNAVEPEYATAYGADQRDLLRSLYVHSLRAGLWLALSAAVVLALSGGWILTIWTHGKVVMDSTLFHWLLISPVIAALWFSALTTIRAANLHLHAALLYCVSSAISVAIAAVLLVLTGRLANAGLALLLLDGAMTLYTLGAASRIVGIRVGPCLTLAINPFPLMRLAKWQ